MGIQLKNAWLYQSIVFPLFSRVIPYYVGGCVTIFTNIIAMQH